MEQNVLRSYDRYLEQGSKIFGRVLQGPPGLLFSEKSCILI